MELRDLIGTAAVKAMTGMEWANVHADFPDRAANAIIAALKANGLTVVSTEGTKEMCKAFILAGPYPAKPWMDGWKAALAASPYAKEFE